MRQPRSASLSAACAWQEGVALILFKRWLLRGWQSALGVLRAGPCFQVEAGGEGSLNPSHSPEQGSVAHAWSQGGPRGIYQRSLGTPSSEQRYSCWRLCFGSAR